jgi:hypothetical protein
VALHEVHDLLAGARELHHRVGDVLLVDLLTSTDFAAERHVHEAVLAELLRRDVELLRRPGFSFGSAYSTWKRWLSYA